MNRFATACVFPTMTVVVLALSGCGGGDSPSDPNGGGNGGGGGGGGGGTPVATTSVQVLDNNFNPGAILVSPGATVTWTWGGSDVHNVTWASGTLSNSETKSTGTHRVTMPTTAGELVYFCTLHGSASGGMRGTVRVQ